MAVIEANESGGSIKPVNSYHWEEGVTNHYSCCKIKEVISWLQNFLDSHVEHKILLAQLHGGKNILKVEYLC